MPEQVVTEVTRRAMATEFGVALPGEDRVAIETAIDALEALERLESELSIYRPGSAISRINALAGIEPVRVSPEVIEVIARGLAIYHLTGGAFDITAGPLVECWGFTRRRGRKPTAAEIAAALELVGSDRITLDPQQRTVFLQQTGMAINLGGIGKGFALDQVAARLVAGGVTSFLIYGGRSSMIARGSAGVDETDGWKIGIEHPLRPGLRLGELRLCDAALATSGSGKQFFHHHGQRLGHVLDPRLGHPSGDMLSITVITATATDADALATACFVEGLAASTRHLAPGRPSETDRPAPAWPTAALAVVETKRQGGVRLVPLGHTDELLFEPAGPSGSDQLLD